MFDLWVRDTEITLLITLSAVLIVLPVQLLLCFKAKRCLVKLLPTILFAVLTPAFYVTAFMVRDWSAIGYIVLAVFSGVLLLFSGLAWGIWAIAKFVKKKATAKE